MNTPNRLDLHFISWRHICNELLFTHHKFSPNLGSYFFATYNYLTLKYYARILFKRIWGRNFFISMYSKNKSKCQSKLLCSTSIYTKTSYRPKLGLWITVFVFFSSMLIVEKQNCANIIKLFLTSYFVTIFKHTCLKNVVFGNLTYY